MKRLSFTRGASMNIGARVTRMPTPMQAGKSVRTELYRSTRWRRASGKFLRANPVCITCGAPARILCAQQQVIDAGENVHVAHRKSRMAVSMGRKAAR